MHSPCSERGINHSYGGNVVFQVIPALVTSKSSFSLMHRSNHRHPAISHQDWSSFEGARFLAKIKCPSSRSIESGVVVSPCGVHHAVHETATAPTHNMQCNCCVAVWGTSRGARDSQHTTCYATVVSPCGVHYAGHETSTAPTHNM